MANEVDISETWLRDKYPEAFNRLLRCHSRFAVFKEENPKMPKKERDSHADEYHIVWATGDYKDAGEGYQFGDMIMAENITGDETITLEGVEIPKGKIIRPRANKNAMEQLRRVKDKAEVFTPSWICNAQNNLIDEAWFGRKDVFNTEITNEDGSHSWRTTMSKIEFPEGKTWEDYVHDTRLEMCCGEAPYLASRYDTVTGEYIEVEDRIGLLDRKLRVISENVDDEKEWIQWAKNALKYTYGFEWQGDSLLLARESLLFTILEHYEAKFGKRKIHYSTLNSLAYIISWNIWQMDGLKMVVPESCGEKLTCVNAKEIEKAKKEEENAPALPGFTAIPEPIFEVCPCSGCATGNHSEHNGIKCRVAEWADSQNKPIGSCYFYELISNSKS